MTEKLSDQWQTPQDLFNWLDKGGEYQGMKLEKGFNFDVDLCSTRENSRCNSFCSDYLNNKVNTFEHDRDDLYYHRLDFYDYTSAFMNPPYSNPKPFIEKAWEDSKHCKIVCLVKCDPSTKWWSTFWQYNSYLCPFCNNGHNDGILCTRCEGDCGIGKPGPKPGCEIRYFPKSIKFDPPQQLIDSGEVWKVGNKWVAHCLNCDDTGFAFVRDGTKYFENITKGVRCESCKGKGYKELTGPTFSSALLIFDRRYI